MKLIDSTRFSRDQLDQIVTAFVDVADGVEAHDFESYTGNHSDDSRENFTDAKRIALSVYLGEKVND